MSVVELYHSVVGDQGKAWVEAMKWGVLSVKMAHYNGQMIVKRSNARRRLERKIPHQRVHISGVVSYGIH